MPLTVAFEARARPNGSNYKGDSSGGKMLDSVSKVERYRKEAVRCAELAKKPPFRPARLQRGIIGEMAMVAGIGAASGRLAVFGALIAVGVVPAMPTAAQTSQQLNWCSNGKHSPNPDQKIAACTAVIQSGRYSGKNLAIVFNNRANGYLKKGDDDRAIADYDQALKLDPNYALAYNNSGNAHFLKKNYDRAIADYDQAIRIDPLPGVVADDRGRTSTNVYNNRGYAYFAKKDFARAIADYDRAVKVDPQDPLTYNNR